MQEILSPEQYATEIPTLPNSRNHVEFAVRMPADGEQPVWLPIDSKFPGDTYAALQDAREQGDPQQVEAARQKLLTVVRGCAKDIRDKYVQPPYTTNFGILFLPFEGLYAEVVNSGLVEQLQREYSISVAGPSTMAAILNARKWVSAPLPFRSTATKHGWCWEQSAGNSKNLPARSKRHRKACREPNSSWNFWQAPAPVPLSVSCGKWNAYSRRNCESNQGNTAQSRQTLFVRCCLKTDKCRPFPTREQAAFLREDRFLFF